MTTNQGIGSIKQSAGQCTVMIEIPKGSNIKYEYDTESGFILVDRKLFTAMYYPCNYGFIPNTLEKDGDPLDVLGTRRNSVSTIISNKSNTRRRTTD